MDNSNKPIHPIRAKLTGQTDEIGLTKREYFAGVALQGLLANASLVGEWEEHAKASVEVADAILKELDKTV